MIYYCMNSEGLKAFIDRKRRLEIERPEFIVEPRLIALDGADGTGKSTLAEVIAKQLRAHYGEDRVVVVITNALKDPAQTRLHTAIGSSRENGDILRLRRSWLAGANRAYAYIDELLAEGKIVVLDKTEVGQLAYSRTKGDPKIISMTEQAIQDGSVTHRLLPGTRIVLRNTVETISQNLDIRRQDGSLSEYDPQDNREIEDRLVAVKEALQLYDRLPNGHMVKTFYLDTLSREEALVDGALDRLVAPQVAQICADIDATQMRSGFSSLF